MASKQGPILKRARALGLEPQALGINKKSNRNPQRGSGKVSEYGQQLKEKQKAKFVYGVQEKQFRKLFARASKMSGILGENLLMLLELRLDNVVYRMGFAKTRNEAKQLVSHGHFLINGKKVDIPSYTCKPGDVISVKENSLDHAGIRETIELGIKTPAYVEFDSKKLTGKYVRIPDRSELNQEINEQLIVEYYSR